MQVVHPQRIGTEPLTEPELAHRVERIIASVTDRALAAEIIVQLVTSARADAERAARAEANKERQRRYRERQHNGEPLRRHEDLEIAKEIAHAQGAETAPVVVGVTESNVLSRVTDRYVTLRNVTPPPPSSPPPSPLSLPLCTPPLIPPDPPPTSPTTRSRARGTLGPPAYTPEFEALWDATGTGSKAKAFAAWNRIGRPDAALLMASWQRWQTTAWADGIGVLHLSTWLNGFDWQQDPKPRGGGVRASPALERERRSHEAAERFLALEGFDNAAE